MKSQFNDRTQPRGFALVVTLSILVLLAMIGVGMLTLSTVTVRTASLGTAQAEAQANARLALMIAIGELQTEMGPDMRVSAESALFDQSKETEAIDGVAQSRWLASYNAWGNWLNADYTPPDGGGPLQIDATYTPQRKKMFRRWLVSLPEDLVEDVAAPLSSAGLDDSNSVILVGEGTLGEAAQNHPDQVTRAYLSPVEETGRLAWWIGPENHKAKITLAKQPRALKNEEWETAQGDTAEVGVGVLPGFEELDDDSEISDKLISLLTLGATEVADDKVKEHFFDLTSSSQGVLASVRTGHLKKDLSLLFEKDKSDLPNTYRFEEGDVREPSIRPMSSEIATRPALTGRHFASWTRMRHFYRMYHQDSDALHPDNKLGDREEGGSDGSSGLVWEGGKPVADCNVNNYNPAPGKGVVLSWDHRDTNMRFPILTSATFILSLKARQTSPGSSKLYCLTTPVYVFWNPYNVELRLPNSTLSVDLDLATVQPMLGRVIRNTNESGQAMVFSQDLGRVTDGNGAFITFKPGEFRVFTASSGFVNDNVGPLVPGFDALNVGGMEFEIGRATGLDNPKFGINFSPISQGGRMFNSQYGNTPGSYCPQMRWQPDPAIKYHNLPFHNHVDWLDASNDQAFAPITRPGLEPGWIFDDQPYYVGYIQLALKSNFSSKDAGWYDTINWAQDWRCRNWIQAPPYFLGKGLYLSNDSVTANTQRIDCPYEFRFGSLLGKDPGDLIPHNPVLNAAYLSLDEPVNAVPALELPTAPIASIAGFAGMRTEPGWTDVNEINPDWTHYRRGSGKTDTTGNTNYFAPTKVLAYQSGITGPGIGNSFLHPIIPRTDVYRRFDNSIASEPKNFPSVPNVKYQGGVRTGGLPYPYNYTAGYSETDNKAYCDYWDHVLLLNDALWDDYFVSSLADQTRPGASASVSLNENLQKLADGEELANARYIPYLGGRSSSEVKTELDAADGYLKSAKHLMVEGMFNVNSTSVDAWHALFAGIRERQVVYRDKDGTLRPVEVPSDKRIALSRFNTATTNKEVDDPESGINRDDGLSAWSGVRFLDDDQLRSLAEKCVIQVKRRGPFLNFSEFINRRLSDDNLGLGTMGALQSAIDYDDANPQAGSINYNFKSVSDFMLEEDDLGDHAFATPEAAVGSRYAGIPGYVIQSDLLKPIANTLSVRDDTFRIRAYGDSIDKNGKVLAQAWCEAIVQRLPEYGDGSNDPEVPARVISSAGEFSDLDDSDLTPVNRRFGRKFQIESFRWLNVSEI